MMLIERHTYGAYAAAAMISSLPRFRCRLPYADAAYADMPFYAMPCHAARHTP